VFHGERLKTFFKQRDELTADAGPGSLGIAIRGVFAPGLAERFEIRTKRGAPEGEQRAEDLACDWMNTGETGESSATEKMGENSFGLIIGGVGRSDTGEVLLLGDLREPFITSSPTGVFEVAFGAFGKTGDVSVRGVALQLETIGESGNEFLVGSRSLAPQLVIEMQNVKDDAEAIAEAMEEPEQRDRIGATRDAYTNAITRTQERLRLERSKELGGKVRLHVGIVSAGDASCVKW